MVTHFYNKKWKLKHYAKKPFLKTLFVETFFRYVYWCVPATLTGFIMSAFLVPAPHCYALRWAIYNGGNSIIGMWSLLGAWLICKIKKD